MLKLPGRLPVLSAAVLFVPLTLVCSGMSYAADLSYQVKDAKLNEVTVFLRGAELFNSAQIDLPAGESEVIFTNIAADINEKTLLIGSDSKVLVKSSVIRRNFLSEKVNSPEIERLESQIEELQENRLQLQIEQQIIDAQLAMLEENSQLGNEKAATTLEDISGMWNFIATQMKDALRTRAEINKSIGELDKKLNSMRSQVQELQSKGVVPGNQLAVKFYSEQPVSTNVYISYAIRNANWVPTYDVSVDKVNGPVHFTYKASVAQASGISWDNVRLKLSTGNLSQSAQAPVLKPNYLALYEEQQFKSNSDRYYMNSVEESAVVAYEVQKAMPESARADKKLFTSGSIDGYVVTNVSGVNTTFDISLPYTIPSDSKQHLVSIKEQQAKGDYRYFVVPKLNNSAFLQVQIADWQELNLLPGKSNVFFEGSFIGEGRINTDDIRDDTMNISLGRDSKIIVERNNVSAMKGKPEFFGNNINQQYGYAIDVKNSRSEPIKLVVADQIPVSRDAQVTVIDVKHDKTAQLNKDTGEVLWTLTMPANGAQKLSLSYTVRYPKDKQVTGL